MVEATQQGTTGQAASVARDEPLLSFSQQAAKEAYDRTKDRITEQVAILLKDGGNLQKIGLLAEVNGIVIPPENDKGWMDMANKLIVSRKLSIPLIRDDSEKIEYEEISIDEIGKRLEKLKTSDKESDRKTYTEVMKQLNGRSLEQAIPTEPKRHKIATVVGESVRENTGDFEPLQGATVGNFLLGLFQAFFAMVTGQEFSLAEIITKNTANDIASDTTKRLSALNVSEGLGLSADDVRTVSDGVKVAVLDKRGIKDPNAQVAKTLASTSAEFRMEQSGENERRVNEQPAIAGNGQSTTTTTTPTESLASQPQIQSGTNEVGQPPKPVEQKPTTIVGEQEGGATSQQQSTTQAKKSQTEDVVVAPLVAAAGATAAVVTGNKSTAQSGTVVDGNSGSAKVNKPDGTPAQSEQKKGNVTETKGKNQQPKSTANKKKEEPATSTVAERASGVVVTPTAQAITPTIPAQPTAQTPIIPPVPVAKKESPLEEVVKKISNKVLFEDIGNRPAVLNNIVKAFSTVIRGNPELLETKSGLVFDKLSTLLTKSITNPTTKEGQEAKQAILKHPKVGGSEAKANLLYPMILAELSENTKKELKSGLEQEKALAANGQTTGQQPLRTSFNIGAMDRALFEKIGGSCKDCSEGQAVSPHGSKQSGAGITISA